MFLGKRRGLASTAIWASLACLAFVAAAIWGWDLAWQDALEFLVICVVLMLGLVMLAAVFVAALKLVQSWLKRSK